MPLSQYQMATPGVTQFGQTANQIAIGLARQKYMMEQQRQEMAMKQAELASQMMHQRAQEALYGAQREAEGAQGEHYKAQANKLNQEQQAAGTLGDVIEGMNKYPATAPDLMPMALGQAARLSGQGQQHVPVNLAQILQMQNPQMQQIMAAGGANKLYQNVPAGATAVSPVAGVPTIMGGVSLPQGNNLIAPQAIDFHQLLNGQMPQRQKVAEGQPKQFAPGGDPRIKELATQGNIFKAIVGAEGGAPDVSSPLYPQFNLTTNRMSQLQQPTSPVQAQSVPDKEKARKEGMEYLKLHPDKAAAIRKRFFDTYGEQLP